MVQFFKSLVFLAKFQWMITTKFFAKNKAGVRYYKDYGVIEAYLFTRAQLREAHDEVAELEKEYKELLSKQDQAELDQTAPKFNLGGKKSNLLS